MDLPWTYQLEGDQRPNPVIHWEMVALPDGFIYPTDEVLALIFPSKGRALKTWGRTGRAKENDPHWIGTKGSTPLHNDLPYPRYTHHLKIRVDPEIYSRGLNKEGLLLRRGLFYILDTHSPHQVITPLKDEGWNISISLDSNSVESAPKTVMKLVQYGMTHPFYVPKTPQ